MPRFMRFFLLVLLAPLGLQALALGACAPASTSYGIATFQDGTFHHVAYDYSVVVQPGTGALMSRDWRLDNYAPSETGLGAPKVTDAYVSQVGVDEDADGDSEVDVTLPSYDLLFRHLRDDGVIFLSTVPVSQHASERDLGVILRDFVESAAQFGQVTHEHSDRTSRTSAPMATRILASRPALVRGFPAHEVIFEVANVQQLELTPSARWERGHVVIVRAEMVFSRHQLQRSVRVPRTGHSVGQASFFPVLMLIGYSNHPDEFDANHGDFRDFLGRIRIGDVWSTTALELVRDACSLDQLDVLVSDGKVLVSSLPLHGAATRCAEDGLLAARFPQAEWMRTFSVRAHPLRASSAVTTAGQPL